MVSVSGICFGLRKLQEEECARPLEKPLAEGAAWGPEPQHKDLLPQPSLGKGEASAALADTGARPCFTPASLWGRTEGIRRQLGLAGISEDTLESDCPGLNPGSAT